MLRIKKLDYFVGVFVSIILNSAKSVPALFDETDESKKVEFETNSGKFNIYVKYSTTMHSRKGTKNVKQKKYWKVSFSENEYEKLKSLRKDKCENCIAIVCTNGSSFSITWIAVLDYDKALKCLREADSNGNRTITVTRIGNSQKFNCTGVGFKDDEYEECYFDFTKYFE